MAAVWKPCFARRCQAGDDTGTAATARQLPVRRHDTGHPELSLRRAHRCRDTVEDRSDDLAIGGRATRAVRVRLVTCHKPTQMEGLSH